VATLPPRGTGWRIRVRSSPLARSLLNPSGLFGFLSVLAIIAVAVFAPLLSPYDPNALDVVNRLSPPTAEHPLGTDRLGRDLLSRLMFGARVALMASLPAVLLGAAMGLVFGMMAGYFGGAVDNVLVVVFDIIRSFPALLFGITIITLTGPSLLMVILIMGITRFPAYARVIRAQTYKVKEEDFVMAAKSLGGSASRVMGVHLFPNVVAPLFIQAAMDIPIVITFEASLSFLGLGVPPPTPSWGTILREGYLYIRNAPWIVTAGGITLMVATLGFTFFAEALRDAFDVKVREA
jgi:peptide/nickel transport system permease protein